MKTTDKILELIKTRGPATAPGLAQTLGLTSMGARQHLQSLTAEGLLDFEDRPEGRGRPARYWFLTEQAQSRFGDRHDELVVRLIDSVRDVFGETGIEQLISHREQASELQYARAMSEATNLGERLAVLTDERSREGYMAALEQDGDDFLLLENHCPICAAAQSCQNFCRSELALFQRLLGDKVEVTREEHILAGARRCAYRIHPK